MAEADISGVAGVDVHAPVVHRNPRSCVVRRHERKIRRHLNSVGTIGGRKIHAVAWTMGMDLTYKPEAVLYRDVGNVVEQRRMDVDKVLALFDQGTPKADQVRDGGNFGAVLAEPEDDSFVALGAV